MFFFITEDNIIAGGSSKKDIFGTTILVLDAYGTIVRTIQPDDIDWNVA